MLNLIINGIYFVNYILILIEVLFIVIFLYISHNSIMTGLFDDRSQKANRSNGLSANISLLIALGIGIGTRYILGFLGNFIIGIRSFDNFFLSLAIMTTVFTPFYKIFLKKFDKDNSVLNSMSIRKVFLKRSLFLIIVSWITYSVFLSIDLLGIHLDNLIPTEPQNPQYDLFLLGFQWAFFFIIINIVISKIIIMSLSSEKKPSEIIVTKATIISSIIAFGIWSIQLIIVELYLSRLFGLPVYEQDIRVLIIVVTVVYFVCFFLSINKIFLPDERRENQKLLQEFIKEEELKAGKVLEQEVILDVRDLTTRFYTEEGVVHAVDGISFKIYRGEVLGFVGETGCGKSVTALSILRLIQSPGKIIKGSVNFLNEDLLKKTSREILSYRGNKITMIFQDPINSLNPVFTVGNQISEVILLHMRKELLKVVHNNASKIKEQEDLVNDNATQIKIISQKKITPSRDTKGKEINRLNDLFASQEILKAKLQELNKFGSIYSTAKQWSLELLKDLNIPSPEQIIDRYPHELSGGMRQRIQIAMAIACSPALLVADEPTTALDVTIQNQILKLMKQLQKNYNTSIMFITHDLSVISKMCDRVAVMYCGSIVEYGALKTIFKKTYHPYTKGLLAAVPIKGKKDDLKAIPGTIPNPIYPPAGCKFHPRCEFCFEPCNTEIPIPIEVEPDYFVSCHLYDPQFKDQIKLK